MNIECIGDERYELGESPIWDPQEMVGRGHFWVYPLFGDVVTSRRTWGLA